MGRTDQYNGVDQDKCYLNIPYMLGCPGRPILSFWCQENNSAQKVSGIYRHRVNNRKVQLVRGFDDVFLAPHSRNTESSPEDIRTHEELVVLAESDEVGDLIVMTKDGKQIFVLGHLEYDRLTLDTEYKRDMAKGLNPENHIITTLMIILITDRYLHGEQHLTAFTVTGLTIMYIRRHLMT